MMRKNVIALVMVVFAVVVVNVMLALDVSCLDNFAKVSLATVEAYGNYENFPEDPFPDSGGKAEQKADHFAGTGNRNQSLRGKDSSSC